MVYLSPDASELLADTEFALRLVSNLMMGTTRVFEAQTSYFLSILTHLLDSKCEFSVSKSQKHLLSLSI